MNKSTTNRLRKSFPAWKRGYSTAGIIFFGFVGVIFSVAYFLLPSFFSSQYDGVVVAVATTTPPVKEEVGFVATHVQVPEDVKAIYMTQCVAGSKKLRDNLVQLIEKTELNSLVIDIKDYSGRMAFKMGTPELDESVSEVCYVTDITDFIETLHKKKIYIIGRITVFQDPYIAKLHPEWAVKKASDKNANWSDRKGIQYLDPGSRAVWNYVVDIAKRSYALGFDELNFDYVRFPSDGNMKDIYFPTSEVKLLADPSGGKAEVIREFFEYLSQSLRPTGAILSADLFGMTTTNTDDLNIGQVLENALPYFDFVAPMVYPSHYPATFLGFKNPADHPYEVIKFAMDGAVRRAVATSTVIAMQGTEPLSTTTKPYYYPKEPYSAQKIRPWLQDFSLGAVYTAEMVEKQIQATYDAGLTSWMLWNASNRYTAGALQAVE